MESRAALSGWLKALSHPARLRILEELARRRTCICGELVDALPLAQSTVSQHLKVLARAGLITGYTDGPRSCYCLDRDHLRRVRVGLDELFDGLEGATDCCG